MQNVLLGVEIQKAVTPEVKEKLNTLRTYTYEFRNKYPASIGRHEERVALIGP